MTQGIIPPDHFKINLNKKDLTKENLMKVVQDVDIFALYTGKPVAAKASILSPLREEKRPSFGYFIGKSGEICFNDFVLGKGDCIKFVQLYFGLNFYDAMSRVVIDFNLTNDFYFRDLGEGVKSFTLQDRSAILKQINVKPNFGIKRREWDLHDYQYWYKYGITKETLIAYNVFPISYLITGDHTIKADKYAYAYVEYKDGRETFKVYQPFSKYIKWLSSHDDSVWQGWNQLPEKGEILIVTKSLKDVMSITEVLKIPSVALQSETIKPKNKIIDELKQRFDDVYILYDNDYTKKVNWGERFSKELAVEHGLYFSQIPESYASKDFSDLVDNIGEIKAKETWDNVLCIPY